HARRSWQLDATPHGRRQTAYRPRVGTAPNRLTPGRADVWDSGRVASATSVGAAYAGPALQSTRRYYWTVQVWDGPGRASDWAGPAWREMGAPGAADRHGGQGISPDPAAPDA